MKALIFLKIVTVLNVLVATGFSVTGMINPALILPPGTGSEKGMTVFALYATARTIPLAAITILSVMGKCRDMLLSLAVVTGLIQVFDGFIGVYQNDVSRSGGPFFIAAVQLVGVYLVKRRMPG